MNPSYQPSVVVLSIIIAILVSYMALNMGRRIALAQPSAIKFWILGGSLSMGIGIWSMHFIGMLAFHLPIPLAYDPGITLLSILPAVLASAIALATLRFKDKSKYVFYVASLLMGLGIVVMHYSGMAALRIEPSIDYDPLFFGLSVIIAVIASGAALYLAFQSQKDRQNSTLRHLVSATVMGCAISGMHYTGMLAARFSENSVCMAVQSGGLESDYLIALVTGFTILVLGSTAIVMFIDSIRSQIGFYKTLLNAQSDIGEGVYIIEYGKPVFANRAMTEMTGYGLDELSGENFFESLVVESDRDKIVEFLTNGSESQLTHRFEVGIYTKDHFRKELELAIKSFLYADRVRQLIIVLDITDRKNAIRALEEQKSENALLARVAEHIDNAVIITNSKGRIQWVNAGFTRVTDYEPFEAIGRIPGELLQGEETDPETAAYIREKIEMGEGFSTEIINYAKSGRKYWVSVNAQPIRNKSGKVEQFITIERDITDWKNTIEFLEAQKAESEMLARVADNTDNGVIILNGEGTTQWVNKGFTRITGYELDDLFGQSPGQVLKGPDTDLDALRELRNNRVAGKSFSVENLYYKKNGEKFWIHITGQPTYDSDGGVESYFVIQRDITVEKQSQIELEQLNQSLEQRVIDRTRELEETVTTLKDTQSQLVQSEKMASLGGLVAGISHEINTPIGIGVTSASNLDEEVARLEQTFQNGTMKKSTLEDFIAHAKQASGILQKNLNRASQLISSFKQVAVDQSSDTWREIDMHDYVDEIIISLRPKWKGKSVEIINDCDRDLVGYSYPGAIYQVLSNLVLNSLIHAFESEKPGEIRFQCHADNGSLELTYHDNGKGIPEEYQSKVFDPFFTTRRGHGGSGLGLHIVFNLVSTNLNGQIKLLSSADEGTTFIITFPYSQQENQSTEST